jgi:tetratricopeptide (TPR) repeat protein
VLLAEQARSANPGNYDAQSLAGDAQLAAGNAVAAQERYARAAEIRMSDNLLHRRFQAFAASGDYAKAEDMVRAWLAQNPIDSVALRLTAMLALRSGDQNRAAAIMEYLRATRGSRDVQLLSDLALLRAWSPVGVDLAETAYGLQRTSPVAAQALGFNYAVQGTHRAQATSLLDKAQRMLGDNPVLAQARTRLGEN